MNNNEWREFLLGTGAVQSESGALIFSSDKEMATENTLCVIAGESIYRVSGEDAESFLQGQLSNDIAALGIPDSQLTTWSNPKGRVLTLFRIVRDEQGYLIRLPSKIAEPVIKRLRMFVLRAKVTIEEQSGLICFGINGDKAASALAAEFQDLPSGVDATVQMKGVTVSKVRGETDRFDVIAPVDAACELWTRLSEVARPSGDSVWRLHNIDAGVPCIEAATSEAFVLQMLNLQHIDGVSFKKGCFPGQEVVARMQYLGKLKRRMFRAQGQMESAAHLPQAGDDVYSRDATSAVGKIVDAQPVGDGTFRLLVVNTIAAADLPLFLDQERSRQITLLELPYPVEAKEE